MELWLAPLSLLQTYDHNHGTPAERVLKGSAASRCWQGIFCGGFPSGKWIWLKCCGALGMGAAPGLGTWPCQHSLAALTKQEAPREANAKGGTAHLGWAAACQSSSQDLLGWKFLTGRFQWCTANCFFSKHLLRIFVSQLSSSASHSVTSSCAQLWAAVGDSLPF